uniref:Uncharacterized protein n=1 Tax=Cyprinus carpio TaxID=7962 RepID=A0A8C1BRT3_CYPCA
MHKDDHLKKTTKFPNSFIIWGCMSSKGPGEMTILTSTVNGQVYIEILDTFLIPLIEKKFGDDVIFQDDNELLNKKMFCVISVIRLFVMK